VHGTAPPTVVTLLDNLHLHINVLLLIQQNLDVQNAGLTVHLFPKFNRVERFFVDI